MGECAEQEEWRCDRCRMILDDDDFEFVQDKVTDDPYSIYQTICLGYQCPKCGYKERY